MDITKLTKKRLRTSASCPAAMHTTSAVETLLRVNGTLPRRAVLLDDGSLADKTAHPDRPEVELVSRLCEVVRQAGGTAWQPRHTAQLLDIALSSNVPASWIAVRNDMATGDFDVEAAAVAIAQPHGCMSLVSCLLSAHDEEHVAAVASAMAVIVPALPEETRAELGHVLACHAAAVADAFASKASLLPRDVRDVVLTGFGRAMRAAGGLPAPVAVSLIHRALDGRKEELLRLIVPDDELLAHVATHAPGLVDALIERAIALPAAARQPVLALVARMLAGTPAASPTRLAALERLAVAALDDDEVDARVCAAVGSLLASHASPVVRVVASSLRACACALLGEKNVDAL